MKNRCPGASRKVTLAENATDRSGYATTVTCPICSKTIRRDRWSSMTGTAIVPFHKKPGA